MSHAHVSSRVIQKSACNKPGARDETQFVRGFFRRVVPNRSLLAAVPHDNPSSQRIEKSESYDAARSGSGM
jgi:hypothetical protein